MKYVIQQRHYLPFPACFRAEKGYTIDIGKAKRYDANEIPNPLEHMERAIPLDEVMAAPLVKMTVVYPGDLPEAKESA